MRSLTSIRGAPHSRGTSPGIVSPGSDVVAGPLYDAEGIVIANCDVRGALHAKRYSDVVGHYSRADLLAPSHPTLPS